MLHDKYHESLMPFSLYTRILFFVGIVLFNKSLMHPQLKNFL